MIIVGLACFAGFAVLLAFSRGPHEGDGGSHALSRSAIGFAGLVELLQETGTPVRISRTLTVPGGPAATLQVLTPPAATHPVASVLSSDTSATLIVLPKWRTRPMDEHAGWVRREGLLPPWGVLNGLPLSWGRPQLQRRTDIAKPAFSTTASFGILPMPNTIDRLQTITDPRWQPMLTDAAGGIVLGRLMPDGPFVLTDPDLLNNLAMSQADGARTALDIVRTLAAGRTIAFDVSLNGFGRSRDPLRRIMEPPLLGATLCAVAAALLIGLLSVRRFGPTREAGRAFDLGKRALADNAAALIARARREPHMARPYAELTRTLAAQAVLGSRLVPADVDALLDRTAASRNLSERLVPLLAAAEGVRDRPALLRFARRLHHWRMELVHGRR